MDSQAKPPSSCCGLLCRRSCWLPTWRGWLVLLLFGATFVVVIVGNVYTFLAVTNPVHGGALVVEGWVPDYALEAAVQEFKRHPYGKLYVTGGPLERGNFLSQYKNLAELSTAILIRLGLSPDAVQAVLAPEVRADRTYASAVALKRWFDRHQVSPTNCHVLSMGSHARRTRLLFEKALGPILPVGITALVARDCDPRRWWQSSPGVHTTLDEVIAYGYARLRFRESPANVPTQPDQAR